MADAGLARLLFVVGLLLLPGPAYADAYEQFDRDRTRATFVASPVDLSDDGALARQVGDGVTVDVRSLERDEEAADLAAPHRTRDVLERAVENGTATASDRAVLQDLVRIDDAAFVGADGTRYEIRVSLSCGNPSVRATPVDDAAVADAVRRTRVVDYDALSTGERRTVDRILHASDGYRPWTDEPIPETPFVLANGQRHYAVRAVGYDTGRQLPDGFLPGTGVGGLGVLSLFGALRAFRRQPGR